MELLTNLKERVDLFALKRVAWIVWKPCCEKTKS